ncbi:MAG: molecular chaperone DnaK [Myxococcota bacterium]|jgi:molecular chaperone DnaK|nr:molecular chaperone DnaK [Myxococcota bacterium]
MGGKIIGIDLGTTNSCVAVIENGDPVVIPNSEGSRTTPSMVAFTESGERLVGQIAKRQAITNPQNTVFAIKRLVGRRFGDEEVERSRQVVPFEIVPAGNGDAWVSIQGKDRSPSEISAMVLQKMKQTAEDYLGEEVTDAVITVPAYFNDSQRAATRDGGRIAGLNVLRIFNEPTAAALAYGIDKIESETIAIYDLGGGTFDISVLEVREGVFQVRATNGDTFLGGEDFDQRIIDFLAQRFLESDGLDLMQDRMALQRLKEASEKAKLELSTSMQTEVNLPFITADASGPRHLNITLTRAELEELVGDLVDATLEPCQRALDDANLKARDIDKVILVGGMTRMPLVQTRVREFFGKDPYRGVNPDEVVAVGAAIQGGILAGEIDQILLMDVTPLSLGVETQGGVFTRIIPRNTPIPCKEAQIFSTAMDNQPLVNIHVLQGEREFSRDNKSLARFELINIPPAPRGVPQIEVSFSIDANGILAVSARDLGTGREQSVRVAASSGLTEAEIKRMVDEAELHKQDDERRKAFVDAQNRAKGLVYTTQRSLEEYGDVLSEQDAEQILYDLEICKQTIDGTDPDTLNEAIRNLENSAYKIAEGIYSESNIYRQTGGEAPVEDQ